MVVFHVSTFILQLQVDGGYSASCSIIVNWEAVIVEKIGNSDYSRIVFNNGKIWNCINEDVASTYNLNENDPLTHKFYENVYQTKVIDDETAKIYYSPPLKIYDNEEIKLIYRIDPLGLAGYIKTFAFESMRIRDDNSDDNDNVNNNDSDVVKMLKYKDDIFCLLFNRKPRHYERDFSGTWYEVSDDYYLDTIFSESEFLFGQHVIYDAYTILELISLAIDVACIALQCPLLSRLSDWTAIKLVKEYYPLVHSVAKSVLNEDFQSLVAAMADGLIDEDALSEGFISETGHKMMNFKLDWVADVLSFSSDLRALSDAFNSGPHFYKEVYTQCINDLKYTIMIRMADNKLVSLAEINKVIE